MIAKTCLTFSMEIAKEGAESLRMKMPNAELSDFKEVTALPARSKIAQNNVKVGKTRLLALVQLRA